MAARRVRVVIFAVNRKRAQAIAERMGLDPGEWSWPARIETLKPYRVRELYFDPSAWSHPDASRFADYIEGSVKVAKPPVRQ